jgi:hypothetical protein
VFPCYDSSFCAPLERYEGVGGGVERGGSYFPVLSPSYPIDRDAAAWRAASFLEAAGQFSVESASNPMDRPAVGVQVLDSCW